ncbi:hypothetical protein T06_7742, partial [Trichinella sp. T6]
LLQNVLLVDHSANWCFHGGGMYGTVGYQHPAYTSRLHSRFNSRLLHHMQILIVAVQRLTAAKYYDPFTSQRVRA